jgi:hypothetical protein
MTGRGEPRFDIDYEYGLQGELYVSDIRRAIEADRIEVKRDSRWSATGNVYVEFECKGRKSGIATTEAELWAFVLGDTNIAVFIPTATLKEFARRLHRAGRVAQETDGSHPTKGVLVPLPALFAFAAKETA